MYHIVLAAGLAARCVTQREALLQDKGKGVESMTDTAH